MRNLENSIVSVLIPTRARPNNLRRSIASLIDLAARPELVEILAGVDDDDQSWKAVFEDVCTEEGVSACKFRGRVVSVFSGPRRGYQGLHYYYNKLAKISRGDYIALWNDDTEVLTPGWDDLLRDGPVFSVQNPRRDAKSTTDYTFPVMGRPIYEAMGHFSLNPYNDAYVSHVAFYTGTAVIRDDVVFHHHCLQDAAAQEHGDDGIRRFHNAVEVGMRLVDMRRVLAAPGHASRFDGYDVEWRYFDWGLKYEYRVEGETRESTLIDPAHPGALRASAALVKRRA